MNWIHPLQSILVHWFLKCRCSLLTSPTSWAFMNLSCLWKRQHGAFHDPEGILLEIYWVWVFTKTENFPDSLGIFVAKHICISHVIKLLGSWSLLVAVSMLTSQTLQEACKFSSLYKSSYHFYILHHWRFFMILADLYCIQSLTHTASVIFLKHAIILSEILQWVPIFFRIKSRLL